MQNNRVVFKSERPKSIALIDLSFLDSFDGHQMLRQVYHRPTTSCKPLSAAQRQNPDSYCLHVADIQESMARRKRNDRTKEAKKKSSVSGKPRGSSSSDIFKRQPRSCVSRLLTASMVTGQQSPFLFTGLND